MSAAPGATMPMTGVTSKLVIADRARMWCGGRNLAAEYFDAAPFEAAAGSLSGHGAFGAPRSPAHWRDLSFDLQGEAAEQAG